MIRQKTYNLLILDNLVSKSLKLAFACYSSFDAPIV